MLALINGNVLNRYGRFQRGVSLFIDQGRIVDCGSGIAIPSKAEIWDVEGFYITPGLIDVHTHLGLDEEGVGWEGNDCNEITQAVTPHLQALDGINPFDPGFVDALQAGVTTVQVLPGSANVMGGLTCVVKVKPGCSTDEMVVRARSGLKIALGENPKKVHGKQGRMPMTRMGVAALLREQFVKARQYSQLQLEKEIEMDLAYEAVGLALRHEIPIHAHAHRADDMMTAIRLAHEFSLDLRLEHCTEGHLILPYLSQQPIRCCIGPTMSSRSKYELRHKTWSIYAGFHQAGIPFAIMSDHPVTPIQHLRVMLSEAIRHGLPESAAWNAVTTHAAEHIGVSHQVGSLEAGKDADIVIWNQHPLQLKAEVEKVLIEGKTYYEKPVYNQ